MKFFKLGSQNRCENGLKIARLQREEREEKEDD